MQFVGQELFILPEHPSSPLLSSQIRVTQSFVFCVLVCRSLFILLFFFFWLLYCLFFSFGHCIVCSLLLAIVLSVLYFWPLYCLFFFFWPLYCLFFTFGHCIVCPLLLAIVLSVLYFWPLYCLSLDLLLLITPLTSSNFS